MIAITRKTLAGNKFAYLMTGDVNCDIYRDEPVIHASKVRYTHASLTRIPSEEPAYSDGTRDVISFHKSESAAAKGNTGLCKYAVAIRVVTISE